MIMVASQSGKHDDDHGDGENYTRERDRFESENLFWVKSHVPFLTAVERQR